MSNIVVVNANIARRNKDNDFTGSNTFYEPLISESEDGLAPYITTSRTLNVNFNADMLDGAHLDTDTALSADSDVKIASQKAVKAYIDAVQSLDMAVVDEDFDLVIDEDFNLVYDY